MSDFGLEYLVEYSQVFDDAVPELPALLNGISRTRLLNVASFFLGFANRGSKFAHYRDFLQMFFSEENTKIGNDIYRRLSQVGKNPDAGIELISPQSILQLFEFCYNHLDENDTQTLAESEVNIFKAILVLNTLNNKTQEQGIDATKDEDEKVKLPALALAMSFPNSEFINSEITEILLGQFVRAVYLFEFLEQNDETKELLIAFLSHFNCATWKEYLKSIFPIAIAVVKAEKEGIIDIVIEHNDDFEKSCQFVDKLILSQDELLEEGYDFRAIRSKPLYKTAEGIYRVVYPLFVVELVFKGLYFKLREIHDGLDKDKKVKGGGISAVFIAIISQSKTSYIKHWKRSTESATTFNIAGLILRRSTECQRNQITISVMAIMHFCLNQKTFLLTEVSNQLLIMKSTRRSLERSYISILIRKVSKTKKRYCNYLIM